MSVPLIACPSGTARWKFLLRDAASFLVDGTTPHIRRLLLPFCLMLLIVAAGVAPAQTLPKQPSAIFAAPSGDGSGTLKRIYPMGQKNGASSKRPTGKTSDNTSSADAAASGGPDLQYYGGPVISSAQVLVGYWGNNSSPVATTGIPGFFSAITNRNWTNTLSEYSKNRVIPVGGGTAGNQSIGRGSLSGAYSITPSAANSGTIVDDTQIQAELLAQIDAGHLPGPATGSNSLVTPLYMIYFPPGVTITLQGAESCAQFCAYHGTVNFNTLD